MKIDGWLGLPPVVFAPLLSLAAAGAALTGLIREVVRSGSRKVADREGAQKRDSD
jgi:hypothetical protein